MFKLKENNTKISTEILAGITTFLTMAYILAVNPAMLSDAGMPAAGVFIATALSAAFASILMGLYANYPIALAPGMGINAFFTYTVVLQWGYSWEAALAAVFISGVLFLLVSITGLRKRIINAIPTNLKLAIGGGIGLFIAFIGFQNAGIIVQDPATLVALGNFKEPTTLLAIIGLVITLVLMARKMFGAVFFGMVGTVLVGLLLANFGFEGMPQLPSALVSFNLDLSTFGGFYRGFSELMSAPNVFLAIFTLLFIDFVDTTGTLVAVAGKTGLMLPNGELKDVDKAMTTDAVGTVVGAMMGTSTVTAFVESSAGVEVGGRTGLTAITTGILFALSIFFYPLLSLITSSVTAPALIVVGILMFQQIAAIDWEDFAVIAAAFTAVIITVLAYSISNGIAASFIVYGVVKLAKGEYKDLDITMWILIAIFIIHFIL